MLHSFKSQRFVGFAVLASLLLSLPGCVPEPDLTRNVVTFHLSSQPDGLHPFNNNSGDRTIIFTYTQKSLVRIDLGSLETFAALVETMPVISDDQLSYLLKFRIYK